MANTSVTLELIKTCCGRHPAGQHGAVCRTAMPQRSASAPVSAATPAPTKLDQHVASDGRTTALVESRVAAKRQSNTASDKQIAFAEKLITELRDSDRAEAAEMFADAMAERIADGEFTKAVASKMIDSLLTTKRNAKLSQPRSPRPQLADVPSGWYAIDPVEPGPTVFYQVDRSATGFVTVTHLVGDSGERVRWPQVPSILDRIAAVGLEDATIRYGHEIGDCGRCGRRLTNESSRRAGIGPICAQKGW